MTKKNKRSHKEVRPMRGHMKKQDLKVLIANLAFYGYMLWFAVRLIPVK